MDVSRSEHFRLDSDGQSGKLLYVKTVGRIRLAEQSVKLFAKEH